MDIFAQFALFLLHFSAICQTYAVSQLVVPANFDEVIHSSISSGGDGLLRLKYEMHNATSAVRVWVQSQNAMLEEPLLVVVRRRKSVLSWQLPVQLETKYTYHFVSRTLCPPAVLHLSYPDNETEVRLDPIYIEFSTSNPKLIPFTVEATLMPDFLMRMNERRYFNVTPSQPQFYGVMVPEDMSRVTVNVRSPDFLCMIVSIQQMDCPVFDMDTDIMSVGRFQAVTTKGTISLDRGQYKEFFLVLLVKPSDDMCTGKSDGTVKDPSRIKSVEIWIEEALPYGRYWVGIASPIIAFAVICLVTICCMAFHGCRDRRNPEAIKARERALAGSREVMPLIRGRKLTLGRTSGPGSKSLIMNVQSVSVDGNRRSMEELRRSSHSCPNILLKFQATKSDNRDIDRGDRDLERGEQNLSQNHGRENGFLIGDGDGKVNVTVKADIVVADLAMKGFQDLGRQYSLYLWNAITFSIFFALPAGLVVYTYRKVVRETGNEDVLVCYYNYQCSRPLQPFYAFNAFYSNIGYVLLGIWFLVIVGHKQWKHTRRLKDEEILETKYGVPHHFGLFYAMGYALIMEGFLSACYHVCPNHTNFQFDTTFMYIIAALCIIKIYQNRHPDITPNSHNAYLVLALLTLLAMIGAIYQHSLALWIIFGTGLIIFVIVASIEFYYNGEWHFSRKAIMDLLRYYKREWRHGSLWHAIKFIHPDRMLFLVIFNAANIFLAWWGIVKPPMAFAMFLIIILFCDLLLYLGFYIFMKFWHREPFKKRALVLLALSLITWGGSLVCFLKLGADWALTPAQSRELNHECVLFEFYDMHDLWHFISSFCLFLSFMAILIMDDGLNYTPQKDIAVF